MASNASALAAGRVKPGKSSTDSADDTASASIPDVAKTADHGVAGATFRKVPD